MVAAPEARWTPITPGIWFGRIAGMNVRVTFGSSKALGLTRDPCNTRIVS